MHLPKEMKKLGLVGAAVAAAMASAPAPAQDATPSSTEEIDEVLVTARRRSETFKDVPITADQETPLVIQLKGFVEFNTSFKVKAGEKEKIYHAMQKEPSR